MGLLDDHVQADEAERMLRDVLRDMDIGELFGPGLAVSCFPVRRAHDIHPIPLPVPDEAMRAIEEDLDRRSLERFTAFGVPRHLLEPPRPVRALLGPAPAPLSRSS